MDKDLKKKILAFNRARKEEGRKASDLDILLEALFTLPQGQLKKLLNPEVLTLLESYGYEGGDSHGT